MFLSCEPNLEETPQRAEKVNTVFDRLTELGAERLEIWPTKGLEKLYSQSKGETHGLQ